MKFCSKCGSRSEDESVFCTSCGSPLGNESQPEGSPYTASKRVVIQPSSSGKSNGVDTTGMLIWSILCIFCCWPAAVASIIYVTKAKNAPTEEEAQSALGTAKTINIINTAFGVLIALFYIVLIIIGVVSN